MVASVMLKFAISICVLLLATPAFSATHKVPEDDPIVTIEIPDKWQTKEVGESVQVIAPGDPVHVLIVPPEGSKIAETMGEAMRYIRNTGGIVVRADSIKKEPGKLNGLDTQQLSWEKTRTGMSKSNLRSCPLPKENPCWWPAGVRPRGSRNMRQI